MNKDVARLIALTAVNAKDELNNLIPILKAHCDNEAEYNSFAQKITAVSAVLESQLIDRVFKLYPDIQSEFEDRKNKYGRIF
jgi:heme oxygenase